MILFYFSLYFQKSNQLYVQFGFFSEQSGNSSKPRRNIQGKNKLIDPAVSSLWRK
jgi:hypothetical protein